MVVDQHFDNFKKIVCRSLILCTVFGYLHTFPGVYMVGDRFRGSSVDRSFYARYWIYAYRLWTFVIVIRSGTGLEDRLSIAHSTLGIGYLRTGSAPLL